MTRDEHLAWAKARAAEYINDRDLVGALTSFASDMKKHPELANHGALGLIPTLGSMHIADGDAAAVSRLIEGFN